MGEMSDAEYENVTYEYRRHVARLRSSLPLGLRLLAEGGGTLSLHDARFIDLRRKVGSPNVLLADIASWDVQHGTLVDNVWSYPMLHVRMVYRNAELLEPPPERPMTVVRGDNVEILYGEIDRTPTGQLEHRMLLWPSTAGSFEVRFDDVDVVAMRFDDGAVSLVEPERDRT